MWLGFQFIFQKYLIYLKCREKDREKNRNFSISWLISSNACKSQRPKPGAWNTISHLGHKILGCHLLSPRCTSRTQEPRVEESLLGAKRQQNLLSHNALPLSCQNMLHLHLWNIWKEYELLNIPIFSPCSHADMLILPFHPNVSEYLQNHKVERAEARKHLLDVTRKWFC